MTINAEKYLENKYQFRITQNHYNRQVEKVQKYDYMKNLFSKDTSKLMTKNLRLRDKKYRESFDNQKVKLFKVFNYYCLILVLVSYLGCRTNVWGR